MEDKNKYTPTLSNPDREAERKADEAAAAGEWGKFKPTEVDPKTVEMIEEIGATAMSELEHEGQTFGDRTLGDEIEASRRPGDRNL